MSHKSNATTERAPRDITRHRNCHSRTPSRGAPIAMTATISDSGIWITDARTHAASTHTPAGDGSTSNLTHCTQCASHSGEPQAAPINDRATPTPTQADIDQPVEPPQGLNGRGARTNVNTRRRDQTQAHTHPRSATLINAVHVHHHDTRIRTRPHNNANLQQHQSRDCATPTPTGVGRMTDVSTYSRRPAKHQHHTSPRRTLATQLCTSRHHHRTSV